MYQTITLWKVRSTHKMGYEAPHFFVEIESKPRDRYPEIEAAALKGAKKRTRLADFPESWKITVEKVNKVLFNGRWCDPKWVEAKKKAKKEKEKPL